MLGTIRFPAIDSGALTSKVYAVNNCKGVKFPAAGGGWAAEVVTIAALPRRFPAFTEAPAGESIDFLAEGLEENEDLETCLCAGVSIAIGDAQQQS